MPLPRNFNPPYNRDAPPENHNRICPTNFRFLRNLGTPQKPGEATNYVIINKICLGLDFDNIDNYEYCEPSPWWLAILALKFRAPPIHGHQKKIGLKKSNTRTTRNLPSDARNKSFGLQCHQAPICLIRKCENLTFWDFWDIWALRKG